MTKETAIGMLKVANTGNDFLLVLDTIEQMISEDNMKQIADLVFDWYTDLDLYYLPMIY